MDEESFSPNARLQEKLTVTYQARDMRLREAIILPAIKLTVVKLVFFPRNLKSDFVYVCLCTVEISVISFFTELEN
jgi:hypothetical protein